MDRYLGRSLRCRISSEDLQPVETTCWISSICSDKTHKRKGEAICSDSRFQPSGLAFRPPRGVQPDNCSRRPILPFGPRITPATRISVETSELKRLCDDGQLERAVDILLLKDQQSSIPSVQTYGYVLEACTKKKALSEVKRVHDHVVQTGLETNIFVGECIVNALVKCGCLFDGLHLFHILEQRTVFGWTAVISAFTNAGHGQDALRMYQQMQEEGVNPNKHTFLSLLRACTSLDQGKQIHADIIAQGCQDDLFVGTTLLDMYARCGSMGSAQEIFDMLSARDVVSWNAIIAGYTHQEEGEMVLATYVRMQEEGATPDERTFVSLLKACSKVAAAEEWTFMLGQPVKIAALKQGRLIHAEAARLGHASNVFIGNTLVHMYATCGSIGDAWHMFDKLPQCNVVSWNAMLAAFAQQEESEKALQLYIQMQLDGVTPDSRTFVSILQACANLATLEEQMLLDGQTFKIRSLQRGKAVHAEAVERGRDVDIYVGNSLIHMYATCGSIGDAQYMFDRLCQSDVFSWNAIISAYTQHEEQGVKALKLYARMQVERVRPNEATFLWALRACSNVGALKMTEQIHNDVVHCGYEWSISIASALIHAYGKCGSMFDAQRVFDSMSQHDVVTWNALIAGYARGGEHETSLNCFRKMEQAGMKPDGFTFVSVLSACSHAGMVQEATDYFESMTKAHGIAAESHHYSVMVDLFGRAALFSQAEDLLLKMPMAPALAMWLSLLGSCRQYNNVEFGTRAFERAARLDPTHGAAYLLMSNIYSQAGLWDKAEEIDQLRRQRHAWNKLGQSWIEHNQEVHKFTVDNSMTEQLYGTLKELSGQMEGLNLLRGQ